MPKKPEPPFIVWADTREQLVPPFPPGVEVVRHMMSEADYSTPALVDTARIERKSVGDFVSTLSWGRERFDREVQRLQPFRWKVIVVEGNLTDTYRVSAMHPHSILGSIASLYARWDVPTLFAGNEVGCGRLMAGILRRWEARAAACSLCGATEEKHDDAVCSFGFTRGPKT